MMLIRLPDAGRAIPPTSQAINKMIKISSNKPIVIHLPFK